ncbi:transcriptional regulator [Thalassobaculum fulvum]|uniref:Transcriptional regulator n=1 Tax=Thalassobaculum fulvum TaxID=1633335 RepID=A0A918XXH4_9PROT|nr:metalloregulator ArsR/SmtB family transcription factor [Thalassobaculum fulvum]GHD63289.1 transcriptional regulator [Thalassobaculum fulvum]
MDSLDAVAAFAALSQPTRLEVFRLLVQAGAEGLAAGVIAERLGVVSSTLSHHLGLLERAGLVLTRRDGRFVYYSANPGNAGRLMEFVAGLCSPATECSAPPAACVVRLR